MSKLKNAFDFIRQSGNSLATLLKVLVQSGKPSISKSAVSDETLLILANGPSLREFLEFKPVLWKDRKLMTVNFAPNTPEFTALRPAYHVLADGHFFNTGSQDENVIKMWEALKNVDWGMTLYIPVTYNHNIPDLPPNISVEHFNLTPAEGFNNVCDWLCIRNLAMPRPRNVLIPAIMIGMIAGFRQIVLTGADHSWSQQLWVDDENNVVSVQPHFYKDNDKELARVTSEYAGYHLHDILQSLTIAFKSYHAISRMAKKRNTKILNATPGSFIDAFPRITYAQMATL